MRLLGACVFLVSVGCGGAADVAFGADPDAATTPSGDGATAAVRGDAGTDGHVEVPIAQVSCTPDGGTTDDPDPAIPRVVSGTNGTFPDTCGADGNLVKQSCATKTTCGVGPNPDCTTRTTGVVTSNPIDCAGLCRDGACASDCPVPGDELTVTESDGKGHVSYENPRDRRHYACAVIFQEPVAYDCAKAPFAGARQFVVGLGLHGQWCTGKDFGNIATASPADPTHEACAMGCSIVP
jgi:hypothetical protein